MAGACCPGAPATYTACANTYLIYLMQDITITQPYCTNILLHKYHGGRFFSFVRFPRY